MQAKRDENRVPTLLGVSNIDYSTPVTAAVNPTTHALVLDGTSLFASLDPRYVNVTGDTMTGDLSFTGKGINTADYIDLLTTATSTNKIGRLRWNDTDKCIEFDSAVDGTILTNQVGQEVWVRCRNNTGSIIGNGKAVYVSGAIGNRPTIALAKANSETTCLTFIGLTTEAIGINQDGFVTVMGSVRGMDTSAFTEGQVLYVSSTTAGELTATRPVAPNVAASAGVVTVKNANNGEFVVQTRIQPTLDRLSNVTISSITDKDLLQYNSSSGRWENKTLAEVADSRYVNVSGDSMTGNLTSTADITTTKRVESLVYDYALTVTDSDHFTYNGAGIPTGWNQVTGAPAGNNTNNLYSFWYLAGSTTYLTWDFNKQTGITPDNGVDAWHSFYFNQILFRDTFNTSDITHTYEICADNAGAIDTTKYLKMEILWDGSTQMWMARGVCSDGLTTTTGTYYVLPFPLSELFVRLMYNGYRKTMRMYISNSRYARAQTMILTKTWGTAPVMGQVWRRITMSRGATGIDNYSYLGAVDYDLTNP